MTAVDRRLPAVLAQAYGLAPVELARVAAGTVTDNFVATGPDGRRWFAKVYRDPGALPRERSAIELAEYARVDGVPVPALRRSLDGDLLGHAGDVVLSLWEYVEDAETAESGLIGDRWAAVGAVLGRLHRRLAGHPAAPVTRQPATGIRAGADVVERYDRLIAGYEHRAELDEFETWALAAARERRALLPRVEEILRGLPALTTQVVHGDLASPNLLLRGDEVAAVIDFQPPGRGRWPGRSRGSVATRGP